MILVTGGLGFIGTHTVRSLLDLGEQVVVVQRRTTTPPADLAERPVSVEQIDIEDLAALREIGARRSITGILHLAGSVPWPPGPEGPVAAARKAIDGLFNVLQVAQDWAVDRVGVASTIGVYGGIDADGPLREDVPLSMASFHAIPAFKKIGELLGDHLGVTTGTEIVNFRIGAIWGPGGAPASPFFAAPQLVHAAATGRPLDLGPLRTPVYAEDSIDMLYVKDCGRALALLQLADALDHRTYNVAAGRATTNAEVVAAIRQVVPEARIDLPAGGSQRPNYLDTTRLRQDIGFQPTFDTNRAVADYLTWLRAGHER